MKVCTFFGQKECPKKLDDIIFAAAEFLIRQEDVGIFYVAETGRFETQVRRVLPKLKEAYPHIAWYVVPSTVPEDTPPKKVHADDPVLRPEGLAMIPKRFSVSYRNEWLIRRCDYVICYNPSGRGIAALYIEKAQEQGKGILPIE